MCFWLARIQLVSYSVEGRTGFGPRAAEPNPFEDRSTVENGNVVSLFFLVLPFHLFCSP